MTRTSFLFAAVGMIVLAALTTFAIGLDRRALWRVVQICTADFKLISTPFPCLAIDVSNGEEDGTVVLRPPLSHDLIVAPVRKISGVEDPFLLSSEAPHYFEIAWRARSLLEGPNGRVPEHDQIALVVNSAVVRHQDQLHIHVGCLLPSARLALAAAAPNVPMNEFAQIGAVVPHTMFWGIRIKYTDIFEIEPVRLVTEAMAKKVKDRGQLTVMVAGVRVEGNDQFLILGTYAKAPGAWWPVGAGELLDKYCQTKLDVK